MKDLNKYINESLFDEEEILCNIDDIVTGKFKLNDGEWEIASLIVQLVADIDKMTEEKMSKYQALTGFF